jgi:hypothetical protein
VALNKLQHSQEDTVDRTLVKNLVVTYFRQRRSSEILGLISKILGFTENDKVEVGLQVSEGSIVSSFFHSFLSPLSNGNTVIAPKKTDIEGDNLAEMWQNFLMQESEDADASSVVHDIDGNTHVAELKNKGASIGSRLMSRGAGGGGGGGGGELPSSGSSPTDSTHGRSSHRSYAPSSSMNKPSPTGSEAASSSTSQSSQGFSSIMHTINSQTSNKTLQNMNTQNTHSTTGRMPLHINADLEVNTTLAGVSPTSSINSNVSYTSTDKTEFNLLPESPVFSPGHHR